MIRALLFAVLLSTTTASAKIGSFATNCCGVRLYEVAFVTSDGFGSSTITITETALTVPTSYLFTFVGGVFNGQSGCGTANSTTLLVVGGFDIGSCTSEDCGFITLRPCT
jgi:hypothetical protein